MNETRRCFVCDGICDGQIQNNVHEIQAHCSKRPIVDFLTKFQSDDKTIQSRDGSNLCVLCDDCIEQFNMYEEASMAIERIQQQFKEKIARTERHYEVMNAFHCIEKSEPPSPTDPIGIGVHSDNEEFGDEGNDGEEFGEFGDVFQFSDQDEHMDSDDSFDGSGHNESKSKQEKPVFNCSVCPAEYYDRFDMQLHTASHMKMLIRCGICKTFVANGQQSIEHENLHMDRSDLQCVFCDEVFEASHLLIHHTTIHNSFRVRLCHICGQKMTKSRQTKHMNQHFGIKKFECEICSRKFGEKSKLARHLITHTGKKPFVCKHDGCGKKYTALESLREHSYTHTDARPKYFRDCSICGKVFKRAGLLAQHYKKQHDGSEYN